MKARTHKDLIKENARLRAEVQRLRNKLGIKAKSKVIIKNDIQAPDW